MENAVERRERFVLAALEAGGDPGEALAQARAMEDFIINGIEARRLLPPPRDPASAEAAADPPAETQGAKTKAAVPPPAAPRKRGRSNSWVPEKIAEFTEMWRADADILQIAAKFNLTEAMTYKRANKLGLGRRRPHGGERTTAPAPACRSRAARIPDTSGLPATAPAAGPEATSIDGVLHFLMSRDHHIARDPDSKKRPRWQVDGLRGRGLTAGELLAFANKERRRIGQRDLIYGL